MLEGRLISAFMPGSQHRSRVYGFQWNLRFLDVRPSGIFIPPMLISAVAEMSIHDRCTKPQARAASPNAATIKFWIAVVHPGANALTRPVGQLQFAADDDAVVVDQLRER